MLDTIGTDLLMVPVHGSKVYPVKMPTIYNKNNDGYPNDAIYVGRGSPFGNPFRIHNGRRDRAIIRYREWLKTQPELVAQIKRELRGKDLLCFCAPRLCHAEILMEIANE